MSQKEEEEDEIIDVTLVFEDTSVTMLSTQVHLTSSKFRFTLEGINVSYIKTATTDSDSAGAR